jgi:hypothetical protein
MPPTFSGYIRAPPRLLPLISYNARDRVFYLGHRRDIFLSQGDVGDLGDFVRVSTFSKMLKQKGQIYGIV